MSGMTSIVPGQRVLPGLLSAPRAADQAAAGAARNAESGAIAQLSLARGRGDRAAINVAQQVLAAATAAATTADAWVRLDVTRVNLVT